MSICVHRDASQQDKLKDTVSPLKAQTLHCIALLSSYLTPDTTQGNVIPHIPWLWEKAVGQKQSLSKGFMFLKGNGKVKISSGSDSGRFSNELCLGLKLSLSRKRHKE